jgi:hypothetical protein
MTALRAPFPWFGGKRRVASAVWDRLGDCPNYVEPFFGSGAVMLARPHAPRIETINDKDAYVANFWRAIQHAPDVVAHYADWPVSEADLHARHRWLVDQVQFRERMMTAPDYFDARIAGWWVWGICQWIGSGWCSQPEWRGRYTGVAMRGVLTAEEHRRPAIGTGNGVHASGVWRKRPDLKRGIGRGVHRQLWQQLPDVSGSRGAAGRGVHASALAGKPGWRLTRKLPAIGGNTGSIGVRSSVQPIMEWFETLAERLRRVRVYCGEWDRILGPSPTSHIGLTAVFLDPPYGTEANRDTGLYAHDDLQLAAKVRAWAIERGDDPKLRIALCGYAGEHEELEARGWSVHAWCSVGGYSTKADGKGRANRERERIWFSPHCLQAAESTPLFAHARARRDG